MTQAMNAYRAAQAYRGVAVSVSPLSAVVMLFDGAILRLQKTVAAAEAKRFEEGHEHLVCATAILRGLSHHLNFEKGGKLAERLYRTYNSLIMACLTSFGHPDAANRYRKIIISLTEMRDAWIVVAKVAAAKRSKA
jgi:flagellar protein FliS